MDRPEHPDQPSIFSRPDRELEDDWTTRQPMEQAGHADPEPAEPSAGAVRVRPARDPLYPGRPPRPERTGPSREVLLIAGGGGLIALLVEEFIVMNVIGGEPTTAVASPSHSSYADPVASASLPGARA